MTSAKIYEFPARGRFVVAALRDEPDSAAKLATSRVAKATCGSAWYHEAAIQEAERPSQN